MNQLVESPVLDWTDCPFVEINPRKLSGTPVLKHSRMSAYAIVEIYVGGSPVAERLRMILSYPRQVSAISCFGPLN